MVLIRLRWQAVTCCLVRARLIPAL